MQIPTPVSPFSAIVRILLVKIERKQANIKRLVDVNKQWLRPGERNRHMVRYHAMGEVKQMLQEMLDPPKRRR